MEVIIGTNNQGKLGEIKSSLATSQITFLSYIERLGKEIDFPETGTTFKENALEKAKNYADYLNLPVLADDGGLILEAFPDLLGLKTARFFKKGLNDSQKNQQLFDLMLGEENRKLSLYAAVAYVYPDGKYLLVEEVLQGELTEKEIGDLGYGFDKCFYLPNEKKTLAELPLEERNAYSPRVRALKKIVEQIEKEG
ncbi:non-canonical purine NTP pyrophosphatase [Vagococcus hydrophili]|uniref:Non-canonical purine NTP pyrophosphatase n=1 Tax=Vagococcus hydrophili TaxID=2714947 RepID=A0A6G8AXF7_9ENTE|nr:non-canonical purine NTP pyrophosphatase [Vagococcus hydrophili]QIL49635.1 non-canonical purine NTP pyrophosphatase [Vagococcus hydrophili]